MSQLDLEWLNRFQRMAATMQRKAKPLRTELRGYAPGDDYRGIDWRVCGRRDELLTKTALARVEQLQYVLVNCSSCMYLGDPPKIRAALGAAAILGWASLQKGERLQLITFSDRAVTGSPAIRRPERFQQVLKFLGACSPHASRTNLENTAREFSVFRQTPGSLVIVSDFLDFSDLQKAVNILGDRGYAPRLVQIYAPSDADPSLLGDVELVDVTTRRTIEATITQRDLERYRALFARFLASIRDYCARINIPLVQTASDAPEQIFLERVLQRI